jgi:hypothetical protein
MVLEGPDQHHLRAAHGYIELGMFEEANAALEEIDLITAWKNGICWQGSQRNWRNGIRKSRLFRRACICDEAR